MTALLIDASVLAHRSLVPAVRDFTAPSGEPTGLRFGFLRTVNSYAKRSGADQVVLAWDCLHPSTHRGRLLEARAERFVEHFARGLRDLGEEGQVGFGDRGPKLAPPNGFEHARKVWVELHRLREAVSLTWWTQAWAEGHDGTHVIAALIEAFRQKAPGEQVLVWSPDHALWHLYHGNVFGWTPPSKKGERPLLIGPTEVVETFKVPPRHVPFYRACMPHLSDPALARLRGKLKQAAPKLREFDPYMEGLAMPELRAREHDIARTWEDLQLGPGLKEVDFLRGSRDRAGLLALFEKLGMRSLAKEQVLDEMTRTRPLEEL